MSYKLTNLATGLTAKNTNCTFEFKGFQVSLSNFGVCSSQVGVFKPDDHVFEMYFDTAEQAINYINSL